MTTPLRSFALLLTALLIEPAIAQERLVHVNGQRMTDQQIAQLELFACTAIPNGNYWLNLSNGAWGYVGNWQVQAPAPRLQIQYRSAPWPQRTSDCSSDISSSSAPADQFVTCSKYFATAKRVSASR
jgi:hypothetical protein